MSNDNVYERLWKLWAMVCKMIMDGTRDAEKVADALQAIVDQAKTYLKKLFEWEIGAIVNGKDTHATAREVFTAYFDPDFENWGIVFSGLAPKTKVVAEELVLNGKFSNFLGNTAVELEKHHMLGSQFLAICRNSRGKLRGDNRANFFVLTKGDEAIAKDLSNVFVASVDVYDDGQLNAYLLEFSDDYVWCGDDEYRVFSLQQ